MNHSPSRLSVAHLAQALQALEHLGRQLLVAQRPRAQAREVAHRGGERVAQLGLLPLEAGNLGLERAGGAVELGEDAGEGVFGFFGGRVAREELILQSAQYPNEHGALP